MSVHALLRTSVAAAAFVGLTATASLAAGQARPHHIRGTIAAMQDHTMTVKTRHMTDHLKLADNMKVFMVSPGNMSDIKQGEFVGITSVEKHGKPTAVEVHVFSEDLRGIGEGHYPWDLESQPNMMTNANIAKVTNVSGGRELTMQYKGGETNIVVPKNAEIVLFTKSSAEALKPGAKVFVIAKKENGATVANAVVVGKDGLKPPM